MDLDERIEQEKLMCNSNGINPLMEKIKNLIIEKEAIHQQRNWQIFDSVFVYRAEEITEFGKDYWKISKKDFMDILKEFGYK